MLSIILDLFDENEKDLKENTKIVINECHKYLRESFAPSVVSLSWFKVYCKFQRTYFSLKIKKENKKDNKTLIKTIIISIYLCYLFMYYIRLIDDNTKNIFDSLLKSKFLKSVIYNSDKKINDYEKHN